MDDALTGPAGHTLPAADSRRAEDWVCLQYQEVGPGLRRYLSRLLGDPELAEDVVQDVFLRLHEAVREGRRIDNLRSWSFQVGHNLAVDHQRRRGVEGWAAQTLHEETLRAGAANAETTLLQAERRRLVRAALSLLTPPERQVLELRAEGLLHREIADLMGLQVSTVSTFLIRAVRKISRQIHG